MHLIPRETAICRAAVRRLFFLQWRETAVWRGLFPDRYLTVNSSRRYLAVYVHGMYDPNSVTGPRPGVLSVLKTHEILPVVLRATYPEKHIALTKSKQR